ncbi:hypothetical protein FA15DRAFT_659477 [Coprinopsis marcescibilis]|uniref:Uncharacterized protein n=1 Tax=Coprinopsis marcescibilis TaxID=230819 RepID=A0A5C3KIS3_COPMA|nr:hypothetical protein FA15DRAFT_659477 [Coprinopsis marcescibilis]
MNRIANASRGVDASSPRSPPLPVTEFPPHPHVCRKFTSNPASQSVCKPPTSLSTPSLRIMPLDWRHPELAWVPWSCFSVASPGGPNAREKRFSSQQERSLVNVIAEKNMTKAQPMASALLPSRLGEEHPDRTPSMRAAIVAGKRKAPAPPDTPQGKRTTTYSLYDPEDAYGGSQHEGEKGIHPTPDYPSQSISTEGWDIARWSTFLLRPASGAAVFLLAAVICASIAER